MILTVLKALKKKWKRKKIFQSYLKKISVNTLNTFQYFYFCHVLVVIVKYNYWHLRREVTCRLSVFVSNFFSFNSNIIMTLNPIIIFHFQKKRKINFKKNIIFSYFMDRCVLVHCKTLFLNHEKIDHSIGCLSN
jgi:hypothetical protein